MSQGPHKTWIGETSNFYKKLEYFSYLKSYTNKTFLLDTNVALCVIVDFRPKIPDAWIGFNVDNESFFSVELLSCDTDM